ncbi:MAG: RsmB/NOP family class I SAM-dependent RNA methyltransferase [Clostridia bacterium]|nr:RsmB/NOP family class I SAM-dependent RNA methyltransferase [Clostridia bacterium]
MLSINEIKRRLPKEFIEELYEVYTPITVDKILTGMTDDRYTTLRVNTLKYDIYSLMNIFKENNVKFERVPWFKDALIVKNAREKDIQKLDIYEKGYIYFQSLSSMVPPLVLNPRPGESVLDMTAAPGSKTTELAMLMENKGEILANELDKIRYERLKFNVQMQGANIVQVINRRGEKLGDEYESKFDKVLLDTPCSGEGRFIATSPQTYRNWSLKNVNTLVKLQKKLFESGYKALKSGGELVYSTCTINRFENEFILDWVLNNFDIRLVDIELDIKDSIKGNSEGLNTSIEKSIKILPSKVMEGFFVAKFRKL